MSLIASPCPVPLSDDEPCGRPIAEHSRGANPVCLMHTGEKSDEASKFQFQQEIEAILDGTSQHHRPKDRFDFQGFVFLTLRFTKKTFDRPVNFKKIDVRGTSDFGEVQFYKEADF